MSSQSSVTDSRPSLSRGVSSQSSAIDSPRVLSRAVSRTSLSTDFTVYSDGEDDVAAEVPGATPVRNICFVGGGYVGGPTAAVMAYCNPNVKVTVVDMNEERIRRWQSKHLPIHEPGLTEVVRIARDGTAPRVDADQGILPHRKPNLFFSTDCHEHIATADIVFLSVNTPTKSNGIGSGAATDISMFESAARSVARSAKPGAVIVEKSTVPCRTAEMVCDILRCERTGVPFEVLSNPEFLAEGTAIADLLQPSRVLIGSSRTKCGQRAAQRLASVYSWVPRSHIITVDVFSSELSKLVANAMLAQRVSSINTISAICEKVGADVDSVARTIGLDPRIGSKFLQAGIGFGGSCFKKDILSLSWLAESLDLPEVADYWRSVIEINEWQCARFVKRVVRKLNGSLRGKKVAVLGYAFKKDTGDTRESQATCAIRMLQEECPLEIAVYDPECDAETIRKETAECNSPNAPSRVNVCRSAAEACDRAAAVLVLTDWDEFRYPHNKSKTQSSASSFAYESQYLRPLAPCDAQCQDCAVSPDSIARKSSCLDWKQVAYSMVEPKIVFDGRGVVDAGALAGLGLRVEAIGKATI